MKIIFPFSDTRNGLLTMFQYGKEAHDIPFEPKKVLVIKGMGEKDERGGHTHHKTRQVLVCIQGSCNVYMDNGKEKINVALNVPHEGILLEPYVWHTMSNFAKDTILLVIADTNYDEADYIRSYEDFLKIINKKQS